MKLSSLVLLLLALFGAGVAQALDFRSVKEAAVLRETPAEKGIKLFVILRGTPVELVLSNGDWSKVRDNVGNLAWMESRLLATDRTLIVRAPRAQIRAQPDDKAVLVFEAERDVLLNLAAPPKDGWVQVKQADGPAGFVRVSQVWGL